MSRHEVDIKVDLKSDGNPPVFELTPTSSLPKWKNKPNDFVFYNNGEDGFVLRYKLQGNALGYRFPDEKDQALYSAPGTCCPTSPGQWSQFEANNVVDNNKTLVVINRNDYEAEFGYTLRVKKTVGSQTKWLELDPGGLNKNGQAQVAGVAQAIVVAAVGAAATILAVFSFGLLKRRSERQNR